MLNLLRGRCSDRLFLGFVVVGLSGIVPGPVHAQVTESTRPALEEIIVTSQRRAENLQAAPVAVTAFTGAELDSQGIVDLKGITERTPGFSMGEFNPGQTQLFVRGIGSNEDGAGGDQSVVVFIDEVYIGRSAGQDIDLFDIERIEVLRGPQGTLFGRNVVGGAISVITAKPTEDPELVVEGSFGNFDLVTLRARASGPIAENLYGKISFSSRSRDGYLENHLSDFASFFQGPSTPFQFDDDRNLRKINRESIRGSLRWLPTDTVELNFGASFSTLDEDSASRHFIGGPAGLTLFAADNALIPNYVEDIHATLTDAPGIFKNDIVGLTARLDWELTDTITLTSLTSHREVDALNVSGQLGTTRLAQLRLTTGVVPFAISGNNDYSDDSKTFTQELRLANSGDSRLQWIAGLYYLDEETLRSESNSDSVVFATFETNPGNLPATDRQLNDTTSVAVFAQGTFDLTDALSVTLGGRYTNDDKTNDRLGTPSPSSPNRIFDVTTDADWSEFTGKVGLNFQLSDDAFFYGTVSEGYKAGGFQGAAPSLSAASTPFEPELATLFEVGAKTEWFDNRLRLNLALFTTDYEDLQILQLLVPEGSPPGTLGSLFTQNAANADIKGAELEFAFAVTDNFFISGSYTKLDTEFTDFFAPAGFRPPDGGGGSSASRIGNELRNAPDNAYNILARYTLPLANGSELSFQGDYRHKDQVNQDPDNLEFASIPEYDLSDVRATWINSNGNFEVAAWINNVFDEDYFIHNFPAAGDGIATAGPPRMWGVTFTFRHE